MAKKDPIVIECDTEPLSVKLTREEKEDRASQAAARAKEAQEWRAKEAAIKQQAKDAKEVADASTRECERLLAQVRSGEEVRPVDVQVEYDEVRDVLVRIRLDTGEVLSERKADEADRDKINLKRQRTLDLDGARRDKIEKAAKDKAAQTSVQ